MYKVITKSKYHTATEVYKAFGNIPQRIRVIKDTGVSMSQATFNYASWVREIKPEEITEIIIKFED